MSKEYDYLLKVLLVGDSDVGKTEILNSFETEDSEGTYKTTVILLDGKKVKLQIYDATGTATGFCTIIRSYSRGAQGIILVYDITNKFSFQQSIPRWLKEVEEHAPGIPKVLVGNRLHLAFKRQVAARSAEEYASRHKMPLFEISPLCDFNIRESFCEVARLAIGRNGMERLWRTNKVHSLQELCCRTIVRRIRNVYAIDTLPIPPCLISHLKSYALTSTHQNFYLNNNCVNNAKNITCKNIMNSNKFSARNNCCIS